MVSSLAQKTQVVVPVQFLLTRLSFVRVTPLFKCHKKIFILSGNMSFQRSLLCHIFPVVMALYIVLTLKISF
jgi:hypothetical protein